MTYYAAGLFFNEDKLALIRKNRPDWQAGKLNAIGGHMEPGEIPLDTMVREFYEETGLLTKASSWRDLSMLTCDDRTTYFFVAEGDTSLLRTMTDEEIVIVQLPLENKSILVDPLPALIEQVLWIREAV